ncbi:hypothetical protein [Pseudoxanthomonas sp. UTMC 1351]
MPPTKNWPNSAPRCVRTSIKSRALPAVSGRHH